MGDIHAPRPRRRSRARRDRAGVVATMSFRYRHRPPFLPDARETVRRIAGRWGLGLASSANRPPIDLVLVQSGLGACFAVTLSTEEVGRGKPAPDAYLEVARRIGSRSPALRRSRGLHQRDPSAAGRRHAHDRGAQSSVSARRRRAQICRRSDHGSEPADVRGDRPRDLDAILPSRSERVTCASQVGSGFESPDEVGEDAGPSARASWRRPLLGAGLRVVARQPWLHPSLLAGLGGTVTRRECVRNASSNRAIPVPPAARSRRGRARTTS
jgi:Haloacid dehalogenase-like hydrolase